MTTIQRIFDILTNRTFWTTILVLLLLFMLYMWLTLLVMVTMIFQLSMLWYRLTS